MKENTHAIIHDVRLLEAIYNDLKDRFEEEDFDELKVKIGNNSKVLFCNRYGVIGLARFVPRRSKPVEIEDFYSPDLEDEKNPKSNEEESNEAAEGHVEDSKDENNSNDVDSSEEESTEAVNTEDEATEEESSEDESTEDDTTEELDNEEEEATEEESNNEENTEEEIITETKTIKTNMDNNNYPNQHDRDSRRIRIDTLLENASVEVDPVVLTKIIKAVDIDYEHGRNTDSFLPNILKYVEDCKTY